MVGKVFRSKAAAVIATAIVTASVVGGIAYAASSPIDSGGVIHGCYNPSTGAMKLRTGATCPVKGMTTPISWNSQGVQGMQGVSGSNGTDGAPGPKGNTGDVGPVGPIGQTAPDDLVGQPCRVGLPGEGTMQWSVNGLTNSHDTLVCLPN